ncbi:MAG: [FeFe] hydrogenase H-cluster radical SAM maturase HydE [Firmicutes bacterium]|nr:[FeFe] hydrogenase H-cluster radical SAM maturase HydE [Bacillota bacterium]
MADGRTVEELAGVLEREHDLDPDGLIRLLTAPEAEPLRRAADRVRAKSVGAEVHLRGLIEFSNYCRGSCYYCGLRAGNHRIRRYRMTPGEIIATARQAVALGLKTIVLQSGEDLFYTEKELCAIVSALKNMDVAVTLSIGERPKSVYAALKRAGADRFLLRIETSNEALYTRLHPGMSYQNRVRSLYTLKELGYEIGTGCLVGLPGQTPAMLAADLLFFKKLDADMIGMGPFLPAPGTPLAGAAGGEVEPVLRMMALARLLMPAINMPATTALSVKDNDGYQKGLSWGANVIMPNMGRREYKRLYAIYPGKRDIPPAEQLVKIKAVLVELGREVGRGYGGRKK